MTPERWAKVRTIFNEVVDAPDAERALILARACGSDVSLRKEVEDLLASDVQSEEKLLGVIGGAVTDVVQGQHNRLVGQKIGAYRITGVLGYGGMGTVYEAERADSHFKQRVAIKLVQQMAVHPQLRSRLRAERQILASLNHPYIARLIDGGETADNIPYLVIEHVDGKPIDVYCDEQKLSVQQRIELFEKVCAAVDYAHRSLVVHRDLKPANILVTADGTPKLLDFGIAKLLNPDPAWNTVAVTRMQDRLLTPEHASPEQVLGKTITTASDVYALGVLLYELLGGRSPYANQNSTPLALERAICNADPPKVSSLFKTRIVQAPEADGFNSEDVAAKRSAGLQRLRKQLGGDIDEIILKAMRKEPEQRYATAGQLADDLKRHRLGEAVLARQGGRRYRAIKFVRRNALSVSLVSLVMLSLSVFSAVLWEQTQRLAAERDARQRELNTQRATSAFLVDIFKSADPYKTDGARYTVRELLDQAEVKLEDSLHTEPEVRAVMLESIAFAYLGQFMSEKAVPLLEKAVEIRRTRAETEPVALAVSLTNLADGLRLTNNPTAADRNYREARALFEKANGPRDKAIADVLVSMARLRQSSESELPEAERLLNEALGIYTETTGPTSVEVGAVYAHLANIRMWEFKWTQAENLLEQANAIFSDRLARTHPDYFTTLGLLGYAKLQLGSLDEAEKLINESLQLQRQVFGEASPMVASALQNLAMLHEKQKLYPRAIENLREALAIRDKVSSKPDGDKGYLIDSIANLYYKMGNLADAEREVRAALEIYATTLASDHMYVASSKELLGEILFARGDAEGAESALRQAIPIWQAKDVTQSRRARAQSTLAAVLHERGHLAEAESLLVESVQILSAQRGDRDELTMKARERLQAVLKAQGKLATHTTNRRS
jgi:serine/threonine protein kinase